MAQTILLDEFHLNVRAPRGLPEAEYQAMRRALDEPRFQAELRRAVRTVFRRHPALGKVRLALSR
jgi:hypothetical protein